MNLVLWLSIQSSISPRGYNPNQGTRWSTEKTGWESSFCLSEAQSPPGVLTQPSVPTCPHSPVLCAPVPAHSGPGSSQTQPPTSSFLQKFWNSGGLYAFPGRYSWLLRMWICGYYKQLANEKLLCFPFLNFEVWENNTKWKYLMKQRVLWEIIPCASICSEVSTLVILSLSSYLLNEGWILVILPSGCCRSNKKGRVYKRELLLITMVHLDLREFQIFFLCNPSRHWRKILKKTPEDGRSSHAYGSLILWKWPSN